MIPRVSNRPLLAILPPTLFVITEHGSLKIDFVFVTKPSLTIDPSITSTTSVLINLPVALLKKSPAGTR